MASHNNTPASVLNAPSVTVTYMVEHSSPNRAKRRHWIDPQTGARTFVKKNSQYPAFNTPFRKSIR